MRQFYENVKKRLGFGCMRLPLKGQQVDYDEFSKMVDLFLERGFNYFDTAHGYVDTQSETAIRECLVKRYPRESYVLTNKLSTHYFDKEEEIRPMFQCQLEACGVDFFDFYLMHAQSEEIYAKFQRCNAYQVAMELKEEGKFQHFGISFHDKASVLEKILQEHPEIEVVQIQFNYVDYDDPSIESRKCYEVCEKYGKPVIVMEPIKGGSLLHLPEEANAMIEAMQQGSPASYAIRFAAGFDQIMMVLSGMSTVEQMLDNTSYMQNFVPLNDEEHKLVDRIVELFNSQNLIGCTACRYCMEECPKQIAIPNLFALMNAKKRFQSWNTDYYYNVVHTAEGRKASDCLKCGKCEHVCPQHLPIRELLVDVAKEFEQ